MIGGWGANPEKTSEHSLVIPAGIQNASLSHDKLHINGERSSEKGPQIIPDNLS
jgi:hypothetical protein